MRTIAILAALVVAAVGQQAYNTVDCNLAVVSWWWNTPHPAWGAALDRGNLYLTPGQAEPPWTLALPQNPGPRRRGDGRDNPWLSLCVASWEWGTPSQGTDLPRQIWAHVGPPAQGVQVGGAGAWQIDLGTGVMLGEWMSDLVQQSFSLPFQVPANWSSHVTIQAFAYTPWTPSGVSVSATGEIWR
jgi:hypothetical protein